MQQHSSIHSQQHAQRTGLYLSMILPSCISHLIISHTKIKLKLQNQLYIMVLSQKKTLYYGVFVQLLQNGVLNLK